MATTTSLLTLTKPDGADAADISVLNGNMDILDNAVTLAASQTLTNKTLTSPHMTTPTVDSGGLTITAGGLTVTAGNVGIGASPSTTIGLLVHGLSTTSSDYTLRCEQSNGGLVFACRNDGSVFVGGSGDAVGFYGATPANKITVSGSKGANAALTSLMSALSTLGLVIDSTS